MNPVARVRRANLYSGPAFEANLIHYSAGYAQARHDHDRASFAILIAGSLIEEVDGRDHSAGPGQASLKPRRVAHADRYGADGATLLSFVFRCDDLADQAIGGRGWQWRTTPFASIRSAIDAANRMDGAAFEDLLWDLLAATDRPAPSSVPPRWLRWARSELDRRDQPVDIGALAVEAGVHRVHFTRQFVRHFGIAPAAYRQRQMAARALRSLVECGSNPAAAAEDGGFADQSHMARAIRAAFGTTPGRISALLGN